MAWRYPLWASEEVRLFNTAVLACSRSGSVEWIWCCRVFFWHGLLLYDRWPPCHRSMIGVVPRHPDALARGGFPAGVQSTATRVSGHGVPRCAWLRVRCRVDFWPLAFPLRGLCVEVGFPAALPGRVAECCMLRLLGRKPYIVSSAELREYREPISKHPLNWANPRLSCGF